MKNAILAVNDSARCFVYFFLLSSVSYCVKQSAATGRTNSFGRNAAAPAIEPHTRQALLYPALSVHRQHAHSRHAVGSAGGKGGLLESSKLSNSTHTRIKYDSVTWQQGSLKSKSTRTEIFVKDRFSTRQQLLSHDVSRPCLVLIHPPPTAITAALSNAKCLRNISDIPAYEQLSSNQYHVITPTAPAVAFVHFAVTFSGTRWQSSECVTKRTTKQTAPLI